MVAFALLCACGRPPGPPGQLAGVLQAPLSTTGADGTTYRLAKGAFEISGPKAAVFNAEDYLSREFVEIVLPPGDYTLLLRTGWQLERHDGAGATSVPSAALTSSNPTSFSIAAGGTSTVSLQFEVENAGGSLVVTLEVNPGRGDGGGDASSEPDGSGSECDAETGPRDSGASPDANGFEDAGSPDAGSTDHPGAGYSLGGSITGLNSSGLVLASAGEPDLTVPSGASSFVFSEMLAPGSSFSVTVKTQPAGLSCSILGGSGTAGMADVLSIAVNCRGWKQVARGGNFTVGIKTDGTLWAWGENDTGQFGDGMAIQWISSPCQIGTETDWASVAAGDRHVLAVKADKTLWAWGDNSCGQLGDGTTASRSLPSQVGSDSDWASAASGDCYAVALKTDGTLWTWGINNHGQLGDGTSTSRPLPSQVGADSDWASVATGFAVTVAIKADGTLWAWGLNDSGQLGDGTNTDSALPKQVGTDSDWAGAEGGISQVIAIKTDGTLWGWGSNFYGELGGGTTNPIMRPSQVGVDSDWASARLGVDCILALKTDGTLWSWGNNNAAQLGDGTTAPHSVPSRVGTEGNWARLVESGTMAIKTDGTLWSWGFDDNGTLGLGRSLFYPNPEQIGADTKWVDAAAGDTHSAAITAEGTLWTWGWNSDGQLGNGTTSPQSTPRQVGRGSDWASVMAAGSHTVAIKKDGSLWAWGRSGFQDGDAASTVQVAPTQIGADGDWTSAAVGSGVSAIKSDGTLWHVGPGMPATSCCYSGFSCSWNGINCLAGQCCSYLTGISLPKRIGNDANWVSVASGASFFAIKSNGTLWGWGENFWGQLGDGSRIDKFELEQIGADANWAVVAETQASSGRSYSTAIKWDGTLWNWGLRVVGNPIISVPAQVGTDADWASVTSGVSHSMVLKLDGTLWGMGENGSGELGIGTNIAVSDPVQVGVESSWYKVAAGGAHTIAIKRDGTLWAWGDSSWGQLGNGFSEFVTEPKQVGSGTP